MTRWVRHEHSKNKRLFPYLDLETYNDCEELIICLSDRSLNIILNALKSVEEMRTRVYVARDGDNYELANEDQFQTFNYWMNDVYNQLGSWTMCNEFLERIAIANETMAEKLTSLDEKAEQAISLNEFIDDLAEVMGIAHPFLLLAQAFRDLFPNLSNVKMNLGTWLSTIYRSRTFEMPMLAALAGMNASLGGMAAAQVGEKTMGIIRTITEAFGGLNAYYTGVREALLGDFNMLDFMQSLIAMFIGDDNEGTGGENPDQDPELRAIVNVATNIQTTVKLDCDSCGIGNSCSCGSGTNIGGVPITEVPDIPAVEEPDPEGDPPPGYGTWEEYDEDKCKRIKHYLDQFIASLRNFAGLVDMGITFTSAFVAELIMFTVPYINLISMIDALGRLFTIGLSNYAKFGDIADYLEDNMEEMICDMMEDSTTEEMNGTVGAIINDAIAALGLFNPTVEGLLQAVAMGMTGNSTLGSIISSTTVPDGYEEFDCPCEGEDLFFIDLVGGLPCGVVIAGDLLTAGNIESSTIDVFGAIRQLIICTSTGEPQDNYFRIDNVLSNSGASGYSLRVYDDSLTLIDSIDETTLEDLEGYESPGCRQFHLYDSGDDASTFVISFSWSETAF